MRKELQYEISPRFCELDGLGHINNSIYLQWFEQARTPLFKIFNPSLSLDKWNLIIARTEVDYTLPFKIDGIVHIKTYLSKIGNSSMIIEHELFQKNQKAAHGRAVMIHYNYDLNKSISIPENYRKQLEDFLIS